jgi:hemolysin D
MEEIQPVQSRGSLLGRLYGGIENDVGRSRDQLAFLPAALEIQETPPSPIGRAIVWVIVLAFVFAAIWAAVGKIDIVAVAVGKIIPSDRVKLVQSLEIGTVKTIHVKEGQQVSKGQSLVTLDGTYAEADFKSLQKELALQKLELLRHEVFQNLLEANHNSSVDIVSLINTVSSRLKVSLTEHELRFQARIMRQQWQEYQARLNAIGSNLKARQAERQVARELKIKLEKTLPIIEERTQSLETLLEKNMVARNQYLELEQQRIERQQDLNAQAAKVQELSQEIEQISSQLVTTRAEYQRNNLLEFQELQRRIAASEQELVKAALRSNQQILYSPIGGTVQQLAIHTVGGVVIAEVKIDTFNFTKYGVIDAEIMHISDDAVSDENLGLVYPARILLKQAAIQVANKWVNLGSGMSVTVEIKTGKRRVIEFFLSPLLRYKQESIRER